MNKPYEVEIEKTAGGVKAEIWTDSNDLFIGVGTDLDEAMNNLHDDIFEKMISLQRVLNVVDGWIEEEEIDDD
jgi:hypothetical protein